MKTSTRYFLIYFGTTLMALIAIFSVCALIENVPTTSETTKPTEEASALSYEEPINMLLVLNSPSEKEKIFSITNLNPKDNQITIATIPAKTQVFIGGVGKTMDETYATAGLSGIKDALSQTFSISVNNTSIASLHDFCLGLSKAGQLKYNLPFDVRYTIGGVSSSILSGTQLLDAGMIENIIRFSLEDSYTTSSNICSDIISEFYSQQSEKLLDEDSDNLFGEIINHFDSDFRIGDFQRMRNAYSLHPSKAKPFVSSIYVSGNTLEGAFFLDKQTTKSLERFSAEKAMD